MGSSDSSDRFRSGGMTSTGSAPTFVANAEELRDLLHEDPSPEAASMRREVTTLLEFFLSWPTTKPTSEQRVRAITQLMDLTTRVMSWVRTRPSPPPRR